MSPAATWPALSRLARVLRATDSFVQTLARETGHGVEVVALSLKDDVAMREVPGLTRFLELGRGDEVVQQRKVAMVVTPRGSEREIVIARALSHVHLDSPAIPPAVRSDLRRGRALGATMAALEGYRRVPIRVRRLVSVTTGNESTSVIACRTRLDIAGTPVARCLEQVTEAALGWS